MIKNVNSSLLQDTIYLQLVNAHVRSFNLAFLHSIVQKSKLQTTTPSLKKEEDRNQREKKNQVAPFHINDFIKN